ncbi:hypothetical protein ACUXAV_002108 [Cupriavidus metallidurans]|uniref:hypothetical protein n=1 Tax=Cupriavidus TaxID=106589 RepID=UPI0011407D87|nr:hypothetical protein [Cupriavidus metallidurans]MDE4921699.1 hypothetical protein [Cupriavidus metallidurans]
MPDAVAAEVFRRLAVACLAGISLAPRFAPERPAWASLSPNERRERERVDRAMRREKARGAR